MTYWLGQDYMGIGPAAHGRLGLLSSSNERSVLLWQKKQPFMEKLTSEQRNLEKLLMGLRLRNTPYPSKSLNPVSIQKALQNGWIIRHKNGICPTLEGSLMLNQLILLLAS